MPTEAAPKRVGVIRGVWVKPGVSKNRRLYKREHIAQAVAEGQKQLADPTAPPITILTSHAARDPHSGDVTSTVGHVTKLGLDADGNATFEAEIADTQAAREAANLAAGGHVKSLSMAVSWVGTPRIENAADGPVETADGFRLRGIDFTHTPGVTGAGITSVDLAEGAPPDGLICEELEEVTFVDEPAGTVATEGGDAPGNGKLPYGKVTYADPGYQADKKKRYPLDTKKHVTAAWDYINVKANADKYTASQLSRMKGRIQKAAKHFGVDLAAHEAFVAEMTEVLEAYASTCLTNGQGTVRVSAYVNDPEQLQAVGRRVAAAAMAGLIALDPDNDGDVDIDGTESSDDDVPTCTECAADLPDEAQECAECGAAVQTESATPSAPDNPGGSPVGTTPDNGGTTESAPATVTLDQAKEIVAAAVTEALAAVGVKPAEPEGVRAAREAYEAALAEAGLPAPVAAPVSTPAAPAPAAPAATEAAPVGAMTAEQFEAFLAEHDKKVIEGFRAEYVNDVRASGLQRRGLVAESESTEQLYGVAEDQVGSTLRSASPEQLADAADKAFVPLLAAR